MAEDDGCIASTYHRKESGKHPNFLRSLGSMMLPIELQCCSADHAGHRERYIPPGEAVMRPRTENQPILGLGLGIPRYPALWIKDIGAGVDIGVV